MKISLTIFFLFCCCYGLQLLEHEVEYDQRTLCCTGQGGYICGRFIKDCCETGCINEWIIGPI